MKNLDFIGDSLDNLRSFPDEVMDDLGYKLHLVQRGEDPVGSKPMKTVGPGARELCAQDPSGWYRIIYYARAAGTVYVLHSFQKKTNQTSKKDIDLAKDRYKDLGL